LWQKNINAIKSGQLPKGKIYEDTECQERNESIILRAVRKDNERVRKAALKKRGVEI